MSEDWADKIAEGLLSRGLMQTGICLILGAVDTGKTTLAAALSSRLAQSHSVGIIDADIGQSHIGPPATIGWAVVNKPDVDFSQITPDGISFVGDITPVGHLLQLTAAVTHSVQQVSRVTELIIIDTPGFITGPAAAALWWTVQQILRPKLILAVQRSNELSDILTGLKSLGSQLEPVKSPSGIPTKSPQARFSFRQNQFNRYFQNSCLYNFSLGSITVQTKWNANSKNLISRLVGLRNEEGTDLAIGVINNWHKDKDAVVVRAPLLDVSQICCLVIGDVTVDITNE
jgi:polynucleotide 5'-hydroxyl-kinase GRC3/NOL9